MVDSGEAKTVTADCKPPVVYGANANYILPALVSIWSLHKNASRPVNFMLFLEAPIEPHDLDLIDRARDRLGLQLERKIFPANIHSEIAGYSELNTKFPAITMLPLVLPRLVEGRCLFLDADTLVMGDVWELLDTDMEGLPIGAAVSIGKKDIHCQPLPRRPSIERIRTIDRLQNLGFMPGGGNYFDSGVLLMDCHVIRDRFPEWETLSSVEKLQSFTTLPDQDRLNQFFHGHWFQLPLKWNVRIRIKRYVTLNEQRFRYAPESIKREMREAAKSPMIWHYMGATKPWRRFGRFPWRLTYLAFRDYYRVLAEFNEILSNGPEHSEIPS